MSLNEQNNNERINKPNHTQGKKNKPNAGVIPETKLG